MNNREEDKKKEAPDKENNINSEYNERVGMGNHPDPTAKRNIGPEGYTERPGQKDKLKNLHIGGDETTGYGANDPKSKEATAQGPGFEFEGSDTGMDDDVAGIRRGDQPLGKDKKKPDDADYGRR
ncbi:hypothetical protein [Pontibacter mangrovi]|uniref:Uncharacterized protein n=1 Tax=Pontibacter mangrovi TaxID=2589816 RepID=A0A501W4P4_9BACT|nr:hypothetical protein [Pontibacter mangrovi]TPE43084.1 hypothetical protein FJM65_15710 [Pontibacter mangrovi]